MKTFIAIAAATLTVTQAFAAQPEKLDSRIATMCGAGHQNELETQADFVPNPAGFYVKSVNTQLEIDDPRVVLTAMKAAYLCTRQAGDPSMSHAEAMALSDQKVVKVLFVPAGKAYPASFAR